MEILNSLDYHSIPGASFALEVRSSPPTSPVTGALYFSSTSSSFLGYNGVTWDDLGDRGVTAVAVASTNGFFGTSSGGDTPSLTIGCSVLGLVKSDGTSLSAAASSDVPTPLTTKGDVFAYTTIPTRLAVGTNGQVLAANSATASGLQWTTLTSSFISDFDTQVRTSRLDQMAAPTSAVSANSQKVTNLANGTVSTDAVNYGQLLSTVQSSLWKAPVRVATSANTTISSVLSGTTLDSVVLATGDRVLFWGQTTASQNGIYTINSGTAPTRATDADGNGEIAAGTYVPVTAGSAAGSIIRCTATGAVPWVAGTSTSTWSADVVSSGALRTRTGNTGGGSIYSGNIRLSPTSGLYFDDSSGAEYIHFGPDASPLANVVLQTTLSSAAVMSWNLANGNVEIPLASSSINSLHIGSSSGGFGFRSYAIKGGSTAEFNVDGVAFQTSTADTTSFLISVYLGSTDSTPVTIRGPLVVTGSVSPSSLSATTNNWTPATPLPNVIRVTSSTAVSITGLTAPTTERRITLCNIGANNITLAHDSASSTAANRFYCPGSTTATLTANSSVDLWYDVTSSRWRVIR